MAQESRSSYDPQFYKSHEEKYQSEDLTLIRLQSVFILLLIGLLASILLFNIEYFVNRLENRANSIEV